MIVSSLGPMYLTMLQNKNKRERERVLFVFCVFFPVILRRKLVLDVTQQNTHAHQKKKTKHKRQKKKTKMSVPPIRCYTCNQASIGGLWTPYLQLLAKGVSRENAMNQLGIEDICCREKFTSQANFGDILIDIALLKQAEEPRVKSK